jgi:transcriptional regulator with GAF, ATPase, and Fis domain
LKLQAAKTIAAIVDNTLYIYNRHGNPPSESPTTQQMVGASSMLITNELGNIAVVTLSKFLIIMVGEKGTGLGLLNEKVAPIN